MDNFDVLMESFYIFYRHIFDALLQFKFKDLGRIESLLVFLSGHKKLTDLVTFHQSTFSKSHLALSSLRDHTVRDLWQYFLASLQYEQSHLLLYLLTFGERKDSKMGWSSSYSHLALSLVYSETKSSIDVFSLHFTKFEYLVKILSSKMLGGAEFYTLDGFKFHAIVKFIAKALFNLDVKFKFEMGVLLSFKM